MSIETIKINAEVSDVKKNRKEEKPMQKRGKQTRISMEKQVLNF